MSLQSKQTEMDETKPDRLTHAILLIGILSVCIVANPWIILLYIYYQTIPLVTLPFFLTGWNWHSLWRIQINKGKYKNQIEGAQFGQQVCEVIRTLALHLGGQLAELQQKRIGVATR